MKTKFEFLGKLYDSFEEAQGKLDEYCLIHNIKISNTWINENIHIYDYSIKVPNGVKCTSLTIKEINDMEEYNPEHKLYWKVTYTLNDHPEYGIIKLGVVANSKKAARDHVNGFGDTTIISVE